MKVLHTCSQLRKSRRKAAPFALLCLLLAFACALAPVAIAQAPGGSIVGKVSEWHRGPLAGARITVTNAQTHSATSVATDVNGEFTAEDLPAGEYQVNIAAGGFVSEVKAVKVKPGHKTRLSSSLKLSPK
jgi:hypothetical protein